MTECAGEVKRDDAKVNPDPRNLGAGGLGAGGLGAGLTALAAVIVIAGIAARFVTRSDLWLDEALTVNIARLPLTQIAPWLRHDGAPPLFYWILHYWTSWFGTSDAAVRSLSGVFGVLCLPLAYLCGKRVGGRNTAWLCVVLLAVNPFAVHFATETRMYALEIFLVFAGVLATRTALIAPTVFRLAIVAMISAALVWTHYWCVSLVFGAGVVVVTVAWRTRGAARRAAVRVSAAIALGAATFALWLPAFFYQSAHTGTPWATPQLPPIPVARTILEFSGGDHSEGWLLVYVAVALLVVGLFGHATGRGTIEIDFRSHSSVVGEAIVGAIGLVLGSTVAYVGGSGFQPRYAAAVLPLFVIVLARGVSLLPGAKAQIGVLVIIVISGAAGIARNVTENRSQTGEVATAIAQSAHRGDLVVYCPDQLGPATHRLLSRATTVPLTEVAYPSRSNVQLIDWVDYVARLDRVTPEQVARATLRRVAARSTIFVVTSPGYITHAQRCDAYVAALADIGNRRARPLVVPNPETFEHAGVVALTVRPNR